MTKPKCPSRSGDGYDVGYGKPPSETRFKPGQSGNPAGRKARTKADRNVWTAQDVREQFKAIAQRKVHVTKNGVVKEVPMMEALQLKMFTLAIHGDVRAMKLVLDYAHLEEPEVPMEDGPIRVTLDLSQSSPPEVNERIAQIRALQDRRDDG